jgi:hypothetical protein
MIKPCLAVYCILFIPTAFFVWALCRAAARSLRVSPKSQSATIGTTGVEPLPALNTSHAEGSALLK